MLCLFVGCVVCGVYMFYNHDIEGAMPPYVADQESIVYADNILDTLSSTKSVIFTGNPSDSCHIVISKQYQTLSVIDSNGGLVCRYSVSVGRNLGDKQRPGDLKTPEGEFFIEKIHDATWWGHDSGDDNGFIPSCYGDWFFRLKTPPHSGIGIHATIRSHLIGNRASEGCICLSNDNLRRLRELVYVGMPVTIETSIRDMEADGRCDIMGDHMWSYYFYYGKEFYYGQPACGVVVQDVVDHVVEEGDTYLSLAVKYRTTRRNIQLLNPSIDHQPLKPGQVVRVAGIFTVDSEMLKRRRPAPFVVPAEPQYYVATRVDNFGRIAVMHRTTRERIVELNPGVDEEDLKAGMTIRVW